MDNSYLNFIQMISYPTEGVDIEDSYNQSNSK